MRKLLVAGSTGSIGTSALDVVRRNPERLRVVGLSTRGSVEALDAQIQEFKPQYAAVADAGKAEVLKKQHPRLRIFSGAEGLAAMCREGGYDVMLSAAVGSAGLVPTLEAIRTGADIAIANKEVLVMAGRLVVDEARRRGVRLVPVDSEHSALFQALAGRDMSTVRRLILTASGGPFFGKDIRTLGGVTPDEACRHPRWSMGRKVSVDSATLLNKGFEMIEAAWLFGVGIEKIAVVIHPQSVVHGIVELQDGSMIAHMSPADMRLPIQHALLYPDCGGPAAGALDLCAIGNLTFLPREAAGWCGIDIALQAFSEGGCMPAVASAADEIAVERFIGGSLKFSEILRAIERVMDLYRPFNMRGDPDLEHILAAERWVRDTAFAAAL